jgi:hypothetical protein
MKRLLTLAVAALALTTAAASAANPRSAFGIHLYNCHVAQNGNSTDGVWVNYTNSRAKTATEVDFAVRYNGLPAVMTDVGSFTQGAQIQHTLHNAMIGAAWNGEVPQVCRVYRVVWADGSISK